jgi:uncharacterized membrane protein
LRPLEIRVRLVLRLLLAALMILAGALHLSRPKPLARIVPAGLPRPLTIVFVSGAVAILGGVGLLVPGFERMAAWGLIVFFIVVFPANLNEARNRIAMWGKPPPAWLPWVRFPMQALLVAWAYWLT